MNSITLCLQDRQWFAHYRGPKGAELRKHFGSAFVPTPYTINANRVDMLRDIAARNPGFTVTLAGPPSTR